MKLRQLTSLAYQSFSKLPEVLQKEQRGYGLLEVEYEGMIFAIPLRSNLSHKHGFKTILRNSTWCGLDYSKALIASPLDFKDVAFKSRDDAEYHKIKENKDKIETQFSKYVIKYIKTVNSGGDVFRMSGHTTLVNFHKQLGIK
jgi:protein AbiQ